MGTPSARDSHLGSGLCPLPSSAAPWQVRAGPCSPKQDFFCFMPGKCRRQGQNFSEGPSWKPACPQGAPLIKTLHHSPGEMSLAVDITASKMSLTGTPRASSPLRYLRKHSGIWEAYSKSSSYFWKCSSNSLISLWLVGQMPFPNKVFTPAGYMARLQGQDVCDLQDTGKLSQQL